MSKRREFKYFTCDRCGARQPDFLIFGVGRKTYCLNHIPWWTRLKMWLRKDS